MDDNLLKFKHNVTKVFGIGIEILNGARSIQTISQDLKLLAFNGIAQAARIGDKQGQSLITLSGFLSDLPGQISPELNDLEKLARKLSNQITLSSITVRKFMIYNFALVNNLKGDLGNGRSNFEVEKIDLLNADDLRSIGNKKFVNKLSANRARNIKLLVNKILELMSELFEELSATQLIISKSEKKIERIRRNGFIANYMGSNIAIESAYLVGEKADFSGLISNIKSIVESLNENLDNILNKIKDGNKILLILSQYKLQ